MKKIYWKLKQKLYDDDNKILFQRHFCSSINVLSTTSVYSSKRFAAWLGNSCRWFNKMQQKKKYNWRQHKCNSIPFHSIQFTWIPVLLHLHSNQLKNSFLNNLDFFLLIFDFLSFVSLSFHQMILNCRFRNSFYFCCTCCFLLLIFWYYILLNQSCQIVWRNWNFYYFRNIFIFSCTFKTFIYISTLFDLFSIFWLLENISYFFDFIFIFCQISIFFNIIDYF